MKSKEIALSFVMSVAMTFVITSPVFAGTQQLVRPLTDLLGMIMGTVASIGTLAIVLGVLGKVFAAHLPGGAEAVVNKAILLGVISQTARLVGLMGVQGVLV